MEANRNITSKVGYQDEAEITLQQIMSRGANVEKGVVVLGKNELSSSERKVRK